MNAAAKDTPQGPNGVEASSTLGSDLIALVDRAHATVILGDPGSGKTTFLKLMTLLLAEARDKASSRGYVPFLVSLAAYAQQLQSGDISLADFLVDHLKRRGFQADAIEAEINAHLRDGRACLMLDGLDEINDLRLRRVVGQHIEDFSNLYRVVGNKVVVTSRIVGYDEVRLSIEGATECRITEFSEDDILDFTEKWTRAVERAAQDSPELGGMRAEQQRIELVQAIRTNDGVRDLARNPLLLTVIAIMKRADVELPQRRVELYHKSIESLLKHWNLARSLGQGGYAVVDLLDTMRVLGGVALWMHERGEGLALVSQRRLEEKLEQLFLAKGYVDAKAQAASFLAEIETVNSVLVERGPEQFSFAHLSFQEYLAAVGMVLGAGDSPDDLAGILRNRLAQDNWWEVGLLAIAYVGVVQQRDEAAGRVLQHLVASAPAGSPENRKLVLFAGQAIADCWPAGVSSDGRSSISESLNELVANTNAGAEPTERLKAADLLGWISPPRPELRDLEHLEFCYVPAGDFLSRIDSTHSSHALDYDYWITRFPISQAQFSEFRERAFGDDRYWSGDGLRWRNDPAVDHGLVLKRSFRTPTRPVCAVTVYEAEAYASWATEALRTLGVLGERQHCWLPNEIEWIKAARGGLKVPVTPETWSAASARPCKGPADLRLRANEVPARLYAHGLEMTASDANYFASGWNETSSLGCYPGAASPYGVEEMCGNVWEWTRTHWGPDWEAGLFNLPYAPDDGRERADQPDNWLRMVQGGSYSGAEQLQHIAIDYRTRNSPDGRYLNHGFRLAIGEMAKGGETNRQIAVLSAKSEPMVPDDGKLIDPVTAVLVDLDGTLVDTDGTWRACEEQMLRVRGIRLEGQLLPNVEGITLERRVMALKAHYELIDSVDVLCDELKTRLLTMIGNAKSVRGAGGFVKRLAETGLKLAIVSNSPRSLIDTMLQRKPWASLVPLRVSSDDVDEGKPSPKIFEYAALRLGVPAASCLVVEDSQQGVKAAVAAGMTCIAVARSASAQQDLRRLTPYVSESLTAALRDLLSLVRQRGRPDPSGPQE